MNTHAPSPYAGEGLYDWLRHRESRWNSLAILHRLDKETSGLIVFGKTQLANRSLTDQFTERSIRKKYLLLSDRSPSRHEFTVTSQIARQGERYRSAQGGEPAESRFRLGPSLRLRSNDGTARAFVCIEAEPRTGRTHQIRVHAAEHGFPILGDTLYGGIPFTRVCLHAAEIRLRHPDTGKEISFSAPADFQGEPGVMLRHALIDAEETTAFRLLHGGSDGRAGWYVDKLGDLLLAQSENPPEDAPAEILRSLTGRDASSIGETGLYFRQLTRHATGLTPETASPRHLAGPPAPELFTVRENRLTFELSFQEGYSVGLFLDQRDNRRRLLTGHVAADFELFKPRARRDEMPEVLNVFAYTCGFSAAAAHAGARTTSLDLSRKNLEWGKRNFSLNALDHSGHDFIFGDAFDWLRRLARKGRRFDLVLLDPPTFSRSKAHGTFRAEKDFGRLVAAAVPLVKPNGHLFASSNASRWRPEEFLETLAAGVKAAQRRIERLHYAPQPPDFPISRAEPAYLKSAWLQLN